MRSFVEYLRTIWRGWNQFWFTPTDPATLALVRILAGSMLLYTHFAWSFGLSDFLGPNGFLPNELLEATHGGRYFVSYFPYLSSDALRWTVHSFNLVIFLCLIIGFYSRTMALLAFVTALMYATRVTPGAFFGLDKINCMLAMYLTLGPCGARYSVDRLLRRRRGAAKEVVPSAMANLAIRLIQVHMCVIYLFGGIAKLQGEMWWDGRAMWFAFASAEYRSIDMTWISYPIGSWGGQPIAFLDFVEPLAMGVVFLETFYCCLVWNRWTRPWVLAGVIAMHVGIGTALGMITFGLAMIYANLAFLSPAFVRWFMDPLARRVTLALAGDDAPAAKGQGT